jgi:hypothetical protein
LGYLLAANTRYTNEYYKWIEIDEKYVFNELVPFCSDKYSIKNTISYLDALKNIPKNRSSFPIQKKELLTSLKFESMVSIRTLNVRTGQNRAKKLLDYLQSVIEHIDKQLKL